MRRGGRRAMLPLDGHEEIPPMPIDTTPLTRREIPGGVTHVTWRRDTAAEDRVLEARGARRAAARRRLLPRLGGGPAFRPRFA